MNINGIRGLAVDTESGRLYVADEGNNRVDVFEVDGDFLFAFGWGVRDGGAALQTCGPAATPPSATCRKGATDLSAAPGQLDRPTSVAVDDNPLSPSHHAIYVGERGNFRVQRFDPSGEFVWMVGEGVNQTTAGNLCTKASGDVCGKGTESSAEGGFASPVLVDVGPNGVLYAVDNPRLPGDIIRQRLQRIEASGAPIPPQRILFEGHVTFALGLGVDSAGDFWIGSQDEGLRRYAPDGTLLAGPIADTDFPYALGLDAADNIYMSQNEMDSIGAGFRTVARYNPSGVIQRRFAYSPSPPTGMPSYVGLAAHTSPSGEVFLSIAEGGIEYVSEPPPGPIVPEASVKAVKVGAAKATLRADVNPEGKATSVHFEYLTQSAYEAQGNSFAGPATKNTSPKPLGNEDFKLNAFEDVIGCPNPASEPAANCLLPETEYRIRVIATNSDGAGEGTAEGQPFTTGAAPDIGEVYATDVGIDSARLHGEANPNAVPSTGYFEYVEDAAYEKDLGEGGDGFAAAVKAPNVDAGAAPLDFGAGEELVTRQVTIYPLQGGTVYHYRLVADNPLPPPPNVSEAAELRTFAPAQTEPCANQAHRTGAGALLPDCRAYEMVSPLDKEGGDIRVLKNGSEKLQVLEQSAPSGGKLAYGSVRSFGGAASAPFTSQYIAQRIPGVEWRTHPIGSPRGRPLLTAIYQAENLEFQAFSADLCQAWQTTFAEPPLVQGGVAKYSNLYRRTDELCSEDGAVHYEALAPIAEPQAVSASEPFTMQVRGVSADGTHAIFTASGKIASGGSATGARQLYESVAGQAPRFACFLPAGSALSGTCTAGSDTINKEPGAAARAISEDGERVFWSASGSGEAKIYVRIGGAQSFDVSKAAEIAEGTSKSRFWSAAADGSTAIFSTGALGEATLYEFDVDAKTTTPITDGVLGVIGISEDASRIYFASKKVLTGEEANGHGDKAQAGEANLYLRDGSGGIEFIATLANADFQGLGLDIFGSKFTTAYVSSDGAHAAFESIAPLTGYDNRSAANGTPTREVYRYDAEADQLLCVSCNPSGSRPAGGASMEAYETPMHTRRSLSDDGSRLYFESADALAARDTNGKVDVYQWEEPGAGGCDEGDAGFSPDADGCIELVSSGQSPQDSRFVEASPSGEDVFLATVESLLPQDFGVFDIYDARVDGGLPIPQAPPPGCQGEACQSPPAPPDDPDPASSSYNGPGNVAQKPSGKHCPKGKRKVKKNGKQRCVKPSSRHRHRGRAAKEGGSR